VLAQRLVRMLCKDCREPYRATQRELIDLGLSSDRLETRQQRKENALSRYNMRTSEVDALEAFGNGNRDVVFYKPKGCEKCANTGFTGRRGIYELLVMDDAVGPLVLKNADAQSVKRAAIDQGMDTLRDDGAGKVLSGMTSVEEVLMATQEDVAEAERPSTRNVRI